MKPPKKRKPIVAWAVIYKGKFETAKPTKSEARTYASLFLARGTYRFVKLVDWRGNE